MNHAFPEGLQPTERKHTLKLGKRVRSKKQHRTDMCLRAGVEELRVK